jgi:hypothetical protein
MALMRLACQCALQLRQAVSCGLGSGCANEQD